MLDLSDTGSSESEEMNTNANQTPYRVSSDNNQIKTCADCGTTKTPLWRGGPSGPKSLCNACGIRSRKKRRVILGLNKEDKKLKKNSNQSSNQVTTSPINSGNNKIGESAKRKLMALGREVAFRRQRSPSMVVGKQWRKLEEEEQAAFLLMALSCGSVFA